MCQAIDAMEQYYIDSNTPPVDTPATDTPPVDTPPTDTPPTDTPPVDTPPVRIRRYRDNYIIQISKSHALDIDVNYYLNLIAKRKCFDAIRNERTRTRTAVHKSNIKQTQEYKDHQIYKDAWYQRKKYEIREKINNRYATDPEFYKRIREVAKQSYYRGRENIEAKPRGRPKNSHRHRTQNTPTPWSSKKSYRQSTGCRYSKTTSWEACYHQI